MIMKHINILIESTKYEKSKLYATKYHIQNVTIVLIIELNCDSIDKNVALYLLSEI